MPIDLAFEAKPARSVLVYGAAGFVGTALVPVLTEMGVRRLILIDKHPMSVSSVYQPDAEIVTIRSDSLISVHESWPVEVAVILAGQTDVDEGLRCPAASFRSNLDIAIEASEWHRLNPAARLIYLSSDEVLGVSEIPLNEDAELQPTQPYATSKACAELTLECYSKTYSLDLVILRSCNLVGGSQRAPKLIPTAVAHFAEGRAVPIFGDGRHIREWMAVEDLCDAIVMAVKSVLPSGKYNCTTAYRLRTLQVVEIVAKVLEVAPRWRAVADRLVHDSSYAMSSERIRLHGWSPYRDVGRAIQRAAKELLKAHRSGVDITRSR